MTRSAPLFLVQCPSCESAFPIDPGKVPEDGIPAICSNCLRVFPVQVPEGHLESWQEASHPEVDTGLAIPFVDAEETVEATPAATGSDDPFGASPTDAVEIAEDVGPADLSDEAEKAEIDVELVDSVAEEAEIEAELVDSVAEEAQIVDSGTEDAVVEGELVAFVEEETETEAQVLDSEAENAVVEAELVESVEEETTVEPEAAEPPATEATFEDLRSLASEALAEEESDGQVQGASPDGGGDGPTPSVASGVERFGRRDPQERARHLARVLVSDIIAYYPERYRDAFEAGTLQEDFRSEVEKSWKEYVDQVGLDMAESTPYFKEALNEVLGKGRHIF